MKLGDLSYTQCYSTVEVRYVDRLATCILRYSNVSLCFVLIIVVFVIADQLYLHTKKAWVGSSFKMKKKIAAIAERSALLHEK